MNKKLIFFFSTITLLLIMVLTNPKEQEHKDAIKQKLNKTLNNFTKDKDGIETDGEKLGRGIVNLFGGLLTGGLAENFVTCDNYVLFSLTKVTFRDTTRTVGIGIFGNVFLSSKIDEVLNRSNNKSQDDNTFKREQINSTNKNTIIENYPTQKTKITKEYLLSVIEKLRLTEIKNIEQNQASFSALDENLTFNDYMKEIRTNIGSKKFNYEAETKKENLDVISIRVIHSNDTTDIGYYYIDYSINNDQFTFIMEYYGD